MRQQRQQPVRRAQQVRRQRQRRVRRAQQRREQVRELLPLFYRKQQEQQQR